jgi:hypothetical protein
MSTTEKLAELTKVRHWMQCPRLPGVTLQIDEVANLLCKTIDYLEAVAPATSDELGDSDPDPQDLNDAAHHRQECRCSGCLKVKGPNDPLWDRESQGLAQQRGVEPEEFMRLEEWVCDERRKSPELAFTAGPERRLAELILLQLKQATERARDWKLVPKFGAPLGFSVEANSQPDRRLREGSEDSEPTEEEQKMGFLTSRELASRLERALLRGAESRAIGEPLHKVADSGYAARSFEGDAWERGWEYLNSSYTLKAHEKKNRLPKVEAQGASDTSWLTDLQEKLRTASEEERAQCHAMIAERVSRKTGDPIPSAGGEGEEQRAGVLYKLPNGLFVHHGSTNLKRDHAVGQDVRFDYTDFKVLASETAIVEMVTVEPMTGLYKGRKLDGWSALTDARAEITRLREEITALKKSHAERANHLINELGEAKKERDDLKKEKIDNDDFMAYMISEFEKFPCMHGDAGCGAHADTPPMFWPELIRCIIKRFVKDKTESLEAELTALRGKETQQVSRPNDTPNIIELRGLVTQLKRVIDDPHPGLFTWSDAYGKAVNGLLGFYGRSQPEPAQSSPLPTEAVELLKDCHRALTIDGMNKNGREAVAKRIKPFLEGQASNA